MSQNENVSVDDLIAEYIERTDAGEVLDAHEFIADWPQHRRRFLTYAVQAQAMQQWVDGATNVGSAAGHPVYGDGSRLVAGYCLTRRLGRGGMASVYEAVPPDGGTPVAIKILNMEIAGSEIHRARFQREARVIRSIDHPAIVPLYDAGQDGDISYLTMQLIDGIDLSDVITASQNAAEPGSGSAEGAKSDRVARAEQAAQVLVEQKPSGSGYYVCIARLMGVAADALQAAHEAGVIHRDIKPSNLLLDADGRLWLTDFGLSCLEESQTVLTQTGDLLGTPRYMSPEQALGSQTTPDHRTDVYSLGATLYELTAFQPAYSGNRLEVLANLADQRLQPPTAVNASIPRPLEAIILKAMSHRPANRYATAAELADDLQRFAQGRPVQAKHPTVFNRIGRWAQAHPGMTLAATAGCLVVLMAFAAGQYLNSRRLESLNVELSDANRVLKLTSDQLQMANSTLDARDAELRRQLYAADLSTAYDAFYRQQMHYARRLLERQVPENSVTDLRGLEWQILDALTTAVTMQAATFEGHTAKAGAVAAIPATREFLTTGHDGFVRRWSLETGQQLAAFEIGGQLDSIAVSGDGEKFAVGKNVDEGVNPLTVRSCADGTVLQTLTGHEYAINALEFSPDGRFLASAGRYEAVVIHDLTTGQPVLRHETGSRNESVAFSPGGEYFAAVIRQQTEAEPLQRVQFWKTERLRPLVQVGSELVINVLDDFADGRRILAASHDQLAVFDVSTGVRLLLTEKVPGRIRSVAMSPDDAIMAATTDSGLLYWWRHPKMNSEGEVEGSMPSPRSVSLGRQQLTDVEFADAVNLLVTAEDGRVHHLDLSASLPHRPVADVPGVSIARDPLIPDVYVTTPTGDVVRVNPQTMEHSVIASLPHHGSSTICVTVGRRELILASSAELTILDMADGHVKSQVMFDESRSSNCRSIAVSPDGNRLYLFHTNHLRVFNTADWSLRGVREVPDCRGDLSPDGRHLLITSGNELQLHDADSLKVRQRRHSSGSEFSLAQYSPDGRYIAIGREDGSFDLLEPDTLRTISTLEGHQSTLRSICFYDNDRRAVSSCFDQGELIFWDLATERLMGKLLLDRHVVGDVLLSEESSWIVISSEGNPLSVWKVPDTTNQ